MKTIGELLNKATSIAQEIDKIEGRKCDYYSINGGDFEFDGKEKDLVQYLVDEFLDQGYSEEIEEVEAIAIGYEAYSVFWKDKKLNKLNSDIDSLYRSDKRLIEENEQEREDLQNWFIKCQL